MTRFSLLLLLAFIFTPAAAPGAPTPVVPTSFAAIGDFGSDYISTRRVARLVRDWKPQFVITLGDNNYPAGSAVTIDRNIGQFYHEFIAPYRGHFGAGALTNRFFPCLGNHDWLAPGAKPYLDYFTLPGNERYYTFSRGPIEFFCLDSDKSEPDGTEAASPQGLWLQDRLKNSKAVWKIVFFHHAPYSSGAVHGTHTGETARMRWPFHEWGVDAVLAGHDHTYERIHTNGVVYIVNGLGGDSRDKFHTVPVAGSVKRYSDDFGALRVDATENYLLFRFFNWRGTQIDFCRLVPKSKRAPAPADPDSADSQ